MAVVTMMLCNFGPYTAVNQLISDLSFDGLIEFVRTKWKVLRDGKVSFVYSLPGHPECMLDNDFDLQNMLFLVQGSGLDRFDVNVKHNIVGDMDEGGSSVSPLVDAMSEYNSVEDVETDILQKFSGHKKKLLLGASWVGGIRQVGQVFEHGMNDFRTVLCKYATEVGFMFDYVKNDKNRVTVVCQMRKEKGCMWRVHASVEKSNGFVYIRSLDNIHSCSAAVRTSKNTRMSSDVIADVILDQIRVRTLTRPVDVVNEFKASYGIDINYRVAWSAVDKAKKKVYGDHSASFDELRSYFEQASISNPGSRFEIDYDQETGHFKRCFVAFYACIYGFSYCRPMLFLDGTFLKGRYKGNLLAATAKDGNQGLFPVAFSVVRSEDEDNWTWFLQNLVQVIVSGRKIIFISDRNQGLLDAVKSIFPTSSHAYCLHHIKGNLKDKLRGTTNSFRENMVYKLRECAYAPTKEMFHIKLGELLRQGGKKVEKFMEDLPFENWSNAYFKGKRYGEMNSNAAESFNAQIRDSRHLPITNMIDMIRLKLMNQMSGRRAAVMKWNGRLCPVMEKKFQIALKESLTWTVSVSSEDIFEVHSYPRAVVNIASWTCSCGQWQINGFPCNHAVAVLHKSCDDPYLYIDPHFHASYYRDSYSKSIIPFVTLAEADLRLNEAIVLPPQTKKQPGRPKKKRIPSKGENIAKKIRCGRCGCLGNHNRKTCNATL